jgi:hypothetical protein
MDTVFNVNKIDDSGLEAIYKMYVYTKDPEKIPGVLDYYKENVDDDFEAKYVDKSCDASAAA